jgi:DNA polymerase I-like protein with 3'-5' exonuclease and polymerase domains
MNIITTKEQLNEFVQHYSTVDAFAYDVETVGDRRGDTPLNQVLWITFATHGRTDVIPMGHPHGELMDTVYPLTGQGEKRVEKGLTARPSDYSRDIKKATQLFSDAPAQLFPAEVFTAIKPLMFNPNILKVGHNLLFDLTSVAKYLGGEVPVGPYFDTMIGSFVLSNKNKHHVGLDDCLKREFGYEMVKGVGKEVEKYAFSVVAKYAYLDAKYTFLLWKKIAPLLTESKLDNVMKLEMDVLVVLCDMKLSGAPIDTGLLSDLHDKLLVDIEAAKAEIYKVAGRQFNINSNQEKQYLLYSAKKDGGRGLSPKILTPKGIKKDQEGKDLEYLDYSVSAEALEHYRDSDPLVTAILNYSDLNKLLTTYVIPYLGGSVTHVTGGKAKTEYKESLLINGHIHGDFVQHGTETGRFSSRNPNLQNIPNPKKSDIGREIRNLFCAPSGYKLVVADYSQIEPRVLASMAQDPILMSTYTAPGVKGDIYTTIGDTMNVTRDAGKVLVLSLMYGVGPDKISKTIGCTVQEAKDLLNRFSKQFPSVTKYRMKVIQAVRESDSKNPYIHTLLGRKRYLSEINSRDNGERAAAERQAFNTRIQGSAADIIKLAMVRAHAMLPTESKLILTVHDELVTLCPDHLVTETENTIKEAMEGINVLKVPLIAEMATVQSWGEAK